MENVYDYSKEYGDHKYADYSGTSDCGFGCGCSAGPNITNAPAGLDPISGECPGNPKDGKLVGGKADYEIVVERRIRSLIARISQVDRALKQVNPSKKKLAQELELVKNILAEKERMIESFFDSVKVD